MRKLAIIFGLLFCAVPVHATWSLDTGYPASNTGCSGSSSTCAVTVTSTTSGDLLWVTQFDNLASSETLTAGSAGCTWVFPANAHSFLSGLGNANGGYVLSATGGVTSITITRSVSTNTNWAVEIREYHATGTSITAQAFPVGTNSASCSSCTAPTVTLSGSSDYLIVSAIDTGNTACSVGSPFGDFSAPSGDGVGDNLTTTSGTGGTFVQGTACPTAAASNAAMISGGFGETVSASPGSSGFGGNSGLGGSSGTGL